MDLLRIAARISSVPLESGTRHKDKGNKFSLSEFKNLSSIREMDDYANERLERLGEGSSRRCYVLSGSKVLKISKRFRGIETGGAGIAQNKAEVDVYTNPKTKPICAKIFDFDPEFRWVISELVRPITSHSEFESKMGVKTRDFFLIARLIERNFSVDEICREIIEVQSHDIDDRDKQHEQNKDVAEILSNLKSLDLRYEDLSPEQWGISASGNIVLLDYGFTTGVYKEFYREQGTGT